jgi:hypothetical protein
MTHPITIITAAITFTIITAIAYVWSYVDTVKKEL